MPNIPHSSNVSASFFFSDSQSIEHQWQLTFYTSFTRGMKIRTLPESWPHRDTLRDTENDRWPNHRLVQNVELNYQIHQAAVFMPHQPPKVTRTTSIMEQSLIESTSVKFHNHDTIMDVWTKSIMARSFPKKRDPSEYDIGRWLPLIKKVTRDRWTQLAVLVSSKTHTTLAQSNLSVSLAIGESFISQHEQSPQRIFRCI